MLLEEPIELLERLDDDGAIELLLIEDGATELLDTDLDVVTLDGVEETELLLRELLDTGTELDVPLPAESPYSKPRPLVPKYKRPNIRWSPEMASPKLPY